ncbi:MAG: acetyltransferase [Lachnospiraceae bacterium]|nr:acetyltransferase [Lachnospiraceae bacterium]
MEKIVILGNGGHARSLTDIIERENRYEIVGYVVNENDTDMSDSKYPRLGGDAQLGQIFQSGIKNAAVGVGYMGNSCLRERLWAQLKQIGFFLPVICDPSAILAGDARIGEGSFIGKGSIVNTNASIGKMCIINTGAIIEHDCEVEDFSHISVGSILCGNVKVGAASFVGANSTVIQGTSIGKNCMVGAGTTIRKNLKDNYMVCAREKILYRPL